MESDQFGYLYVSDENLPMFMEDCLYTLNERGQTDLSAIEMTHLRRAIRSAIEQQNLAVRAFIEDQATPNYAFIDVSLEALCTWFHELYDIEYLVERTPDGSARFFGTTEPEREYIARLRDRAHQL